ncbi:molybdopterin oxidoreductase [Sphaerisporangium rufum]|uniref:Molybdopterin oxidoreductase n=1 Tax=Sphaerisporangium rufum TaxID=1381558 RepID=A0A919V1Z0_9ACTN|nr:molybdopterin oxidoreductase family protein [Sphaerisporangium rufum]GII79152.1 molybdopterin oxidoreductase [Sphaerisporangium rufum]
MPISHSPPAAVMAPAHLGEATHCPYCALQCGMNVRRDGDGAITITPRDDVPANAGALCQKGWTAGALLTGDARLTTPLARADRAARLEPVGYDEALDQVADRLRDLRERYGPDAVAVFGGGGLTNEKAYQLGKFARVALGTSQIDYNGRFCMSSAAAAAGRAFGLDRGLPFPITDIAAAEVVLMAGGNVAETMPPFMRHLKNTLIVVDPRETRTARQAALHLKITPGTDLALALGLLHIALTEGHADLGYIAARTAGFDAVRASVATWWPERAERVTGVPAAAMRRAVELLGGARTAMILTGRGAEQHAKGADTVTGFINLALALGLPGRPGSGYGCVTGQGNGQGGREHGQKADQLPGYRRIDDPAARAHVAGVWGVDPADLPGPGRSAYELLDALGTPGGPRALLVFGSNPVVSAPRARHIAGRLAALDLLVVADVVLSETAALADVVLPVTQWAEEHGTMTNLEGRVLLRRRAVDPPPGVRGDLAVMAGLAARLGHGAKFSADPGIVFDELRRASAGGPADYSGITYERIAAETGVFWPAPAGGHPGTPRPFLDRFPTPDGRARFVPVGHRPPAEEVDDDYPYYLTTGRVLAQYQSGAQTRRIAALNEAAPETFVEMHPDLAARLGVTVGDPVRITSRRGSTEAAARVTPAIRHDTVFMPFHWEGANHLTNPALDPLSRMPEFKVCAVHLARGGPAAGPGRERAA